MKKSTDPAAKYEQKRLLLIERTARSLQVTPEQAIKYLGIQRQQSFRINPLRTSANADKILDDLRQQGWKGKAYPWCLNGYNIEEGFTAVRDSQYSQDGSIYIQNAASWIPVLALDPQANDEILEMCAAPGGKASHIAAITNNQAQLWANDNSPHRVAKMKQNFNRLNVNAKSVSLRRAELLPKVWVNQHFNKILLDAPCSGEGLINIQKPAELRSWSLAHIKRLQGLQKRLVLAAWNLLKPGGTLVYSTCTIAPEENEAIIDYLLKRTPNAITLPINIDLPNRVPALSSWNDKNFNEKTSACLRLAPSENTEAFFVCRIQKSLVLDSLV